VTSLTLGSQTYTQADLLTLFDTPPRRRDDAGDSIARGQRGAWSDGDSGVFRPRRVGDAVR
jgi:hypothetical protein